MVDRLKHGLMSFKRWLLPLLPDSLMAQYRFRREQIRARFGIESEQSLSRTNVDVVVERSSARRWLLSSPDTVRIIDPDVPNENPADVVVVPDRADATTAMKLLGRDGITVVVLGRVEEPRWGRRTAGTEIEPSAIVTTPDVLAEIGGLTTVDGALPVLLDRLVHAGHRLGLIPQIVDIIDPMRSDPISRESVVILAAVPLHDVGGGSRGAQIALELARLGYHVVYVNRYPSYEAVDLGLRYIHPELEQVPYRRFDVDRLTERCEESPGMVIVELPDPAFEPALTALRSSGWSITADLIDDWSDPALGGEWFDPSYEQKMIADADAVTASAIDLLERATTFGRDDAVLVPNAVNVTLFGAKCGVRPPDLPEGTVIGYHGSLYGDWLDWDAVTRVAEANDDASIVMIGEDRNVPRTLPGNVVFLGLKAQTDLPAYLQNFTIGFVPFALTPTTHAVSPLKVYEYLASGIAVAAPPLRALDRLDGVYTDIDLVLAVETALDAPGPDRAESLRLHSWHQRLTTLFSAVGRPLRAIDDRPVEIVQRPVVHYGWNQRHITIER